MHSVRSPRAVVTLTPRCPACDCRFAAVPRDGSAWLTCVREARRDRPACRTRWLALALPPGTTGRYLCDVLGPARAADAIRAAVPLLEHIADGEADAVLWAQVLVAATAPAPGYLLIGPVAASVARDDRTAHGPIPWILASLGLREAA